MARKDIVARIGRLAKAVTISEERHDSAASLKWASRLADAATSLVVIIDPPDETEEIVGLVGGAGETTWYNPSAGVEGSPQANALANGSEPYIAAGYGQSGVWLPGFSPNSARAWWAEWFANPFDMRLVDPAALPGSLVLSAEQGARAVAQNKKTNPPPPRTCAGVPCPPNPNLYEGSSTLAAIRDMIASGNPNYPPFAPGVTFPDHA